jgi:hypothetical protein
MKTSSSKKTTVAVAVAGTIAAAIPPAEANVINVSWRGAFTFLNPAGAPVQNTQSDYAFGYYANGDGTTSTFGSPYFPGNVGTGADCTSYAPACITANGWNGNRTPVSGTLSFDSSTGAGVGTVNPFFFFGDVPGSGVTTTVARFLNPTFQFIDTVGTILGTMLFSWNGNGQQVSIVLDGSGVLANVVALIGGGPTSTISGVGALPATDGINFGTAKFPNYLPLGPSPVATKSMNTGAGCDGLTLATQVNAYHIATNMANLGTCITGMTDDGIGGDPMTGTATSGFNVNFDLTSIHFDSFLSVEPVPVPPAVWLFGSGLLGLAGVARRRIKSGGTNN